MFGAQGSGAQGDAGEGGDAGGNPGAFGANAGAGGGNAAAAAATQNVSIVLKPNHIIHLKSPDQVDLFMEKAESYICQHPMFRAELEGTSHPSEASSLRQEQILNFLIQTVEYPLAFQEIKTISTTRVPPGTHSRRGHEAWQALKNFFYNQGSVRLVQLQQKLQKKQGPAELGGVYVTRVLNARAELKEAGDTVTDLSIKTILLNGLRREYRPFVADALHRFRDMTVEEVALQIRQAAITVEADQQSAAAEDSEGIYLGSVQDPFGFQQPPQRQLEPAQTAMISVADFRSYLSAEHQQLSGAAYAAVDRALMAATLDQRRCYNCGQQGHLSYACPERQMQAPGRGPQGRFGQQDRSWGGHQSQPQRPMPHQRPAYQRYQHPTGARQPQIMQRTFNNSPAPPDLSGRAPIRPAPPSAPAPSGTEVTPQDQQQAAHQAALAYEDDFNFYDGGMMALHSDHVHGYWGYAGSSQVTSSPLIFHDLDDICDDNYEESSDLEHLPAEDIDVRFTPDPWSDINVYEPGLIPRSDGSIPDLIIYRKTHCSWDDDEPLTIRVQYSPCEIEEDPWADDDGLDADFLFKYTCADSLYGEEGRDIAREDSSTIERVDAPLQLFNRYAPLQLEDPVADTEIPATDSPVHHPCQQHSPQPQPRPIGSLKKPRLSARPQWKLEAMTTIGMQSRHNQDYLSPSPAGVVTSSITRRAFNGTCWIDTQYYCLIYERVYGYRPIWEESAYKAREVRRTRHDLPTPSDLPELIPPECDTRSPYAGVTISEVGFTSPLVFVDNLEEEAFAAVEYSRDQKQVTREQILMETLLTCRIVPLPAIIQHLTELCAGGTLPGLTAVLHSGITVRNYTLCESSNAIRYIALHRLTELQREHPHLISTAAIASATSLSQNVLELDVDAFKRSATLPPPDVVVASPMCTPFSQAGNSPGWCSHASRTFISCVNLIRALYDWREGQLTYVFKNVPASGSYQAVLDALGEPLLVDGPPLGSTAYRKTALWTNGASRLSLQDDYLRSYNPGPVVSDFLERNGHSPDWQPVDPQQQYLAKIVSRPGSWAFSFDRNGKPGMGMLLYQGVYVEPSIVIREEMVGMRAGATAAPGAPDALRFRVIGGCWDHNIARWFFKALMRNRPRPKDSSHIAAVSSRQSPAPAWKQHKVNANGAGTWIVDGGATSHVSAHRSDFWAYRPLEPQPMLDGIKLPAAGIGSINVTLATSIGKKTATLHDVLHVPGMINSTTSVTRLFSQRASQHASKLVAPTYILGKDRAVIDFGVFQIPLDLDTHRNLYTMHTDIHQTPGPTELVLAAIAPVPASPAPQQPRPAAYLAQSRNLWHRRLGHISPARLQRLPRDASGVIFTNAPETFCKSCAITKSVRIASGRGTSDRKMKPLSKVGCDIWSHKVASINGYYYILGFTCYSTSYAVIYRMRTKDEAPRYLQQFLAWAYREHHPVHEIRCDSDAVFKGRDFREVAHQSDTAISYSAPYTPTENGLQERTWGIIMPMVRAMLSTAELPQTFWDFAALTAVYLHNRLYHSGCNGVPITLLTGMVPNLSHVRTFGCPAYVHVPHHQRKKMEDTAFEGILVGYDINTPSGYLVYNSRTRRTISTKHVRFDETFGGRLAEEGMKQPPEDSKPQPQSFPLADSSSDDEDPIFTLPANTPANSGPPTTKPPDAPQRGERPEPSSGNNSGMHQPEFYTPHNSPAATSAASSPHDSDTSDPSTVSMEVSEGDTPEISQRSTRQRDPLSIQERINRSLQGDAYLATTGQHPLMQQNGRRQRRRR